MDRKLFGTLLAIIALLLYLTAVIAIVFPYLTALLWGAIIGIMLYPLYLKLQAAVKNRENLAASLMTLAVMIALVVPLVALIASLTHQAPNNIEPSVTQEPAGIWEQVKTLPLVNFVLNYIGPYLDWLNIDVQETLQLSVQKTTDFVVEFSTTIVKKSLFFTLELIIMAFALFFIFRDGKNFLDHLVAIIPLKTEVKEELIETVREVLSKVLYGLFLACLVQGILASIGYWLAKLQAPFLLGALTAVAALIPVVGTALVWVPVAVFLLLQGMYFQGMVVLLWGSLLIGPSDNVIRIIFMSGRTGKTYISPLVVLLGLLGGVSVFGFIGIVLGPIILSLLFSILDLYVRKPPPAVVI